MMIMKTFIIYLMTTILFTMNTKKFLISLISIEMIMISTAFMLLMSTSIVNSQFLIIYFLVFLVTESVMGLSLLIMMSRIHKNDMMKIMEMMW